MTDSTEGPEGATVVRLKLGREAPVREGHPWVFSGAVERVEGAEGAGVARVVGADGRALGNGFFSPRSQIRVRMVTGAGEAERAVDRGLFAERLAAAGRLREAVVGAETTGYRVVNAEGDGLPGWTVDRFGEVLVAQVTSAGLEAVRGEAYAALAEAFPGSAIVQSNDVAGRRPEGLGGGDEAIAGEVPEEVRFTESGLVFTAETAGGQKTGFYCDQRENRRLAERLAGGRTVLDLFAHGGAFGLYALRGGAARVVHVESSPRLLERGQALYPLNPALPAERAEWVKANVFEDLRRREERYGLVVCDPPPMARRRGDIDRAARAYKDLNRLAFARVEAGGHLLTFSCSGAVDTKLFRQVLFAAAVEASVRVRLLQPLAAAPDHPVAITHPQGEYLKGWWCEVW
jgi:23S rRNA (cytosine1962-C5)-methyltransferase